MDDDFTSKIAMRIGLALLLAAVGIGIYKFTQRTSPYAVPEPLKLEFRELSAIGVGGGMSDSRGLTQTQLDSMLYSSVGSGTPAMVGWLLQRGASPRANQKAYGASYVDRSALQQAASHGRCELEQLLIKRVEELAILATNGSKERKSAAAAEQVALFVNEADPNRRTPLHHAVLGGERACIAVLLAAGARVDAKDAGGLTPLAQARQKQFNYLVPILKAALVKQGGVDEDEPAFGGSLR